MSTPVATTFVADYHDPVHEAAVRGLIDAYARDRMGMGAPLPHGVLERVVPELALRPNAFSILAQSGDDFVGLTNCFEAFSTFTAKPLINIHDVFVKADWRSRGVGQAMLREVERQARLRGCLMLTLEVWEGNFVAQKSYRHFGFNEGAHDPELGGHLFWKKRLT
jgi:GNAT superfamily N-acetyltransferase